MASRPSRIPIVSFSDRPLSSAGTPKQPGLRQRIRNATLIWAQSTDSPERIGVPDRTRTCDPRFRKPMLYPAELRGLFNPLPRPAVRFVAEPGPLIPRMCQRSSLSVLRFTGPTPDLAAAPGAPRRAKSSSRPDRRPPFLRTADASLRTGLTTKPRGRWRPRRQPRSSFPATSPRNRSSGSRVR